MPKFNSQVLLNDLKEVTERYEKDFEFLIENYEPELLQSRPEENKWSAIECIEHLNMTGRYYLPKIQLLCHICIVNHGLSSETCANPLFSLAYGVN